MNYNQCQNCKYAVNIEGSKQFVLNCFRYPPTVVLVPMRDLIGNEGLGIQPARPPVLPTGFCGEFVKKEVLQ